MLVDKASQRQLKCIVNDLVFHSQNSCSYKIQVFVDLTLYTLLELVSNSFF